TITRVNAKNSAPRSKNNPEALQKVKISHKTEYTGLLLVITPIALRISKNANK
ncbi:MAG: hypothetical protein RLZZ59_422, partial [Pseudomonadota bacterium]